MVRSPWKKEEHRGPVLYLVPAACMLGFRARGMAAGRSDFHGRPRGPRWSRPRWTAARRSARTHPPDVDLGPSLPDPRMGEKVLDLRMGEKVGGAGEGGAGTAAAPPLPDPAPTLPSDPSPPSSGSLAATAARRREGDRRERRARAAAQEEEGALGGSMDRGRGEAERRVCVG